MHACIQYDANKQRMFVRGQWPAQPLSEDEVVTATALAVGCGGIDV